MEESGGHSVGDIMNSMKPSAISATRDVAEGSWVHRALKVLSEQPSGWEGGAWEINDFLVSKIGEPENRALKSSITQSACRRGIIKDSGRTKKWGYQQKIIYVRV